MNSNMRGIVMSREPDGLDPKVYRREGVVDKAHYLGQAFADAEAAYLWPRVWQVACREEEIPAAGNYIAYDIVDDSIIVTRGQDGEIRAFHNVCPHRGRRLVGRSGTAREFVCGYHGWRWNLDGSNSKVVDRHDWQGCISDEEIGLQAVKVATWGGFVFINMDADCEPLETFLAPVI
jgi:phenylpropionate dioxygenase-like ring-hydroxylating dioxygenase large terminal subunit